ncbi:response regulator [Piscinibacter terrae]|uniref:response regulator n=1 Tax=Piscinibacter terrae TaxID=2496871 RepID=UPI0013868DA5|nr:response regulator [Albitalea terrae]
MHYLMIEDDEDKARTVQEFIRTHYPSSSCSIAKSLNGGLRALISGQGTVDLVLMDMSMPNYDVTPDEPSGGTPESFAGQELLAQMKLRGIEIPVIIITMFDKFGEKKGKISLEQLAHNLHTEYGKTYKGYVYYNAAQEGWKPSLRKLIDAHMKEQS